MKRNPVPNLQAFDFSSGEVPILDAAIDDFGEYTNVASSRMRIWDIL